MNEHKDMSAPAAPGADGAHAQGFHFLHSAPVSTPSEQNTSASALPFGMLPDDMKALRRFHECVTDGEGYDVPQDMMKRLAEIGVLRRTSGRVYEHTTVGLAVLDGEISAARPAAANAGHQDTTADEIVTRLYRRFKDWSKRGFGPDDVTWCEVKADVRAMMTLSGSQSAAGVAGQPAADLSDTARLDWMEKNRVQTYWMQSTEHWRISNAFAPMARAKALREAIDAARQDGK